MCLAPRRSRRLIYLPQAGDCRRLTAPLPTMIPLSTDRPIRRTPIVNEFLVAMNIVIALVISVSPAFQAWSQEFLWLYPPVKGGAPAWTVIDDQFVQARPALWQFVTYQFFHDPGGVWHIAGNMLFLWVFGNAIEDRLGHFAYLCFYLAGGVIAGVAHAATSDAPVLGASGSVSAVTGAFLALFPYTNIRVFWFFLRFGVFELPSLWFIALSVGRDIFYQLQGGEGVAYIAHLGGNLFGFGMGMGLLWTRLLVREPYDLMSLLTQWNRRRAFRATVRQGYDPWSGRKPGREGAFANPFARKSRRGSDAGESPGSTAGADGAASPEGRVTARRAEIAALAADGRLEDAAAQYLALKGEQPALVLGAPAQLDVANHLFARGQHAAALQAYRDLLQAYPNADPSGRIHLMIGLTLTRYLHRPAEAREALERAVENAPPGDDREMAKALLAEANAAGR